MKRGLFITVLCLGTILALTVICTSGERSTAGVVDSEVTIVTTVTLSPTPTVVIEPSPTLPFTVGDIVPVNGVTWKVLKAENLGNKLSKDDKFTKPLTTSGKFILVTLEIENNDVVARTYYGVDMVDKQGRTFTSSFEAINFVDNQHLCTLDSINPGIRKTCTAIYELPQDSTGLKVVVGDLVPFGEDAEIYLDVE